MVLDARQLKRDYQPKWPLANAREYAVLSMVRNMLGAMREEARRRVEEYRKKGREPPVAVALLAGADLDARLVGLGAGSSELVEDTYHGVEDAFDIAVYVNGSACCWVEVTGVDLETDLKPLDGTGQKLLCVGTWKLRKARRFNILDRTWFAFVVSETGRVRYIRASYLDQLAKIEDPVAVYAHLRRKERESVCVRESLWKTPRKFYENLRFAVKRFLLAKGVR